MKYSVIELTMDGSFFDTNYHGLTKEEAQRIAKELTAGSRHSQYFIEKED